MSHFRVHDGVTYHKHLVLLPRQLFVDGDGVIVDCDFDNLELTCPRCGFNIGSIGGDASWRKNCPLAELAVVPGIELICLIEALGGKPKTGCGCYHKAAEMNRWGVEGCRRRRSLIVSWLRRAYRESDWESALRMAWSALRAGKVRSLNPDRLLFSLVDEAIARAEAKIPVANVPDVR